MKFKKLVEQEPEDIHCWIKTEVVRNGPWIKVRIHCDHGAFTGHGLAPGYGDGMDYPRGLDGATEQAMKGFRKHAHPAYCGERLPPPAAAIFPKGSYDFDDRPGCKKWPEHDGEHDHFIGHAKEMAEYQYDVAVHYRYGNLVENEPCPRRGEL